MKETKWTKPLMRASIHIIEHKNSQLEADNGIWVGISYPRPVSDSSDEGGFFIKVAPPGVLKGKNLADFADKLDTMLDHWLEENDAKIAALAMKCAKGGRK